MVALVEVLQGGYDMENPSASERVTTFGSEDGWKPVSDGIRMDGEWEHKPVCQKEYERQSVRACRFFPSTIYLILYPSLPDSYSSKMSRGG